MNLLNLWESFPELVKLVRQDHKEKGAIGGGHNFLHALMVAQYAFLIAEDRNIGTLAWIAGICHNTDRLFPEEVELRLKDYLNLRELYLYLGELGKQDITEAVLNHSKLNDPKDNPVTVILKDADRLANIGPNLFIRSGQLYHQLPDYDPRYLVEPDPEATYKDPKTCLHDIRCSLEWKPWLRVPKAKKRAKPWFDMLQIFVDGFAKQLEQVNLLPYPFPEDFE